MTQEKFEQYVPACFDAATLSQQPLVRDIEKKKAYQF